MKYKIDRLDDYGRGITYINGKITFVPLALPEEEVELEVVENTKKYNLGKVTKYTNTSSYRVKPACPYYPLCGGCDTCHMSYSYENTYKEEKVKSQLTKFTNYTKDKIRNIIYSHPTLYRNKIILHGTNNKLGLYEKDSNKVIPIDKCLLVNNKINEVINILNEVNIGIEEVLIRTSNNTKEVLVNIKGKISNIDKLLTITDVLIINNKLYTKEKYIITNISNYKYSISSNSFFQINRYVTEMIYDEVVNIVSKIKPTTLLDLYCGGGTIGIYISKYAKCIVGVDNNPSNIENANKNKSLNNINNISFISSKVEDVIDKFSNIDLIIVDPPRKGLDKKTKENLLRINSKDIIYVSCNPITLMRDINDLNSNYNLEYITPFNNFPRTYHIEAVAHLKKLNIEEEYNSIVNPNELLKFMKKYIDYGIVSSNDVTYTSNNPSLQKAIINNYYLSDAKRVLKYRLGICFDQVELERDWFSRHKYNFKTYFIWFYFENTINNYSTHTYLIYKRNNKYYYFESSDTRNSGIYEFDKLEEAIKYQMNLLIKYNKDEGNKIDKETLSHIEVVEYEKPEPGINFNNFIDHVTTSKIIYKNNKFI